MHTQLAAGLLSAPLHGEVGDILWKNASFETIKDAKASLSMAAAEEIISSRGSDDVAAFVAAIPSASMMEALAAAHPSDEAVLTGITRNPWTPMELLESIQNGTAPRPIRALALTRVKRAESFIKSIKGADPAKMLASLDAIISHREYSCVIDALLGDDAEAAATALAQIEQKFAEDEKENEKEKELYLSRRDFRVQVLEGLRQRDEDTYDLQMYRLLGINEEPERALSVDRYIANWLCEGSFWAQAAEAMLVPDGGARKSSVAPEFAGRLTSAARQRFKKHDTLWDLVAYKTTRALDEHALMGAKRMDCDQLLTYKNMGMTADELSGWVSSSTFQMETDQLLEILEGITPRFLSNLLLGMQSRFLEEGQALALLRRLDDDELEELAALLKGGDGDAEATAAREQRLKDLPWYPEIKVCMPGAFNRDMELSDYQVLADAMLESLGEDPALWAQALDAAETWPGSFMSLLDSVN